MYSEGEIARCNNGWKEDDRVFKLIGTYGGCGGYVKANCLKQAIQKFFDTDEFVYTPHWYTRSHQKSWAEVWSNEEDYKDEYSRDYRFIVKEI